MIDVKDIMIGDYFIVGKKTCAVQDIKLVDGDYVIRLTGYQIDLEVPIDELKPSMLTKDFFQYNGFSPQGEGFGMEFDDTKIYYNRNTETLTVNGAQIKVKYYHEFKNALNVMKIDLNIKPDFDQC